MPIASKNVRIFLIDCSLAMEKERSFRQRFDTHMPPLALMMLTSNLKKSDLGPKSTVHIADAAIDYANFDELTTALRDFRPDVVGLRCLSIHTETLRRCAEIAKTLDPVPLVIAGGPHVSSVRQQAFKELPDLDMVVIGEGEDTFYDLVSAIYHDKDPSDIPGTISRTATGIKHAPARVLIQDLDTLAITDWSQIDFTKYEDFMTGFAPVLRQSATIMTTRGCPYRCVYCHEIMGKKYRKRSADHVLREIQLLHDLGIRDINIIDDNFNFDNKRAVTIFNEIEKRNLGMRFYFGNGVRGDRLPKDVLDAMVSGGTIYMVYALETGSERMQKYIKKGLNLNKFEQSIRYAIDTGIMVEMFTMVGFPTETEEEIGQTLDFAMKLEGLCMIYLNAVNYFPGTELFNMALNAGISLKAIESQDKSQGYMGNGINKDAVENAKFELAWFLMQEERIAKVLNTQRKFLTEREIEVLHRLWWGANYQVSNI